LKNTDHRSWELGAYLLSIAPPSAGLRKR